MKLFLNMLFLLACALLTSCAHVKPPVVVPPSATGPIEWDNPKPVYRDVDAMILFPSNVDTLTRKQVDGLKKTAHKANLAGKALRIVGHADTVGSEAYNLALGRRRAMSVHLALLANGCFVPMSVESYGEVNGIPAWSRKVTVRGE